MYDQVACCKCGRLIMHHGSPSEEWLAGQIKCRPCLQDESGAPPFYTPEDREIAMQNFLKLFGEP